MTYLIPSWWPWVAVAIALVALVSGVIFVRRDHPYLPRRLRSLLWLVRVLIAAVLLLCLLDWRTEVSRSESEKPMLHAIVDRSASMEVKDEADGVSRYEMALRVLDKTVQPQWNDRARLATGTAGSGFAFGDPALSVPNDSRSALGRSLREGLEQQGDGSLGGVILFSDGAASDVDELRSALQHYRAARVPVYPWVLGSDAEPNDLRIVSADLRQPSPSQAQIHLDLTLDSPGYAGKVTTLSIRLGEQVLHQQTVNLEGKRQSVSVDFPSPYLGCHFYDIDVSALEGESITDNNRSRAACDLRRDPIRVLYMEGSAPREISFLKEALESDPEMSVTSLHFPGDQPVEVLAREAEMLRGKDQRVFHDSRGREVPSVCHPTRGYPATLEKLLEYDVVIDSDIIKEAFSPRQLADTVAFVERFGGGFVMVGGNTSFGAGGYETTVIDKLMPVEIANKSDPIWSPFQVKLTESGRTHPMMQVGASPTDTQAAWTTKFPGFQGANYARRAKPGAHVLARTSSPSSEMNDLVLFAVQHIGRGRTMAFMSDTTEAWGTAFETSWGPSSSDPAYFRRFWNNTIRWLAADRIARKSGQVVIDVPRKMVNPGDTVAVRVAALTAADLAGLTVTVKEGEVSARALPLQWNGADRRWEGSFVPQSAGDVLIEAVSRNPEGKMVSTRTGIVVRSGNDESVAIAARRDLMEEMARETGGVMLDQSNVAKILKELGSSAVPVVWKRPVSVWDRWFVLLPLLALVSLEWLLRRKREPLART